MKQRLRTIEVSYNDNPPTQQLSSITCSCPLECSMRRGDTDSNNGRSHEQWRDQRKNASLGKLWEPYINFKCVWLRQKINFKNEHFERSVWIEKEVDKSTSELFEVEVQISGDVSTVDVSGDKRARQNKGDERASLRSQMSNCSPSTLYSHSMNSVRIKHLVFDNRDGLGSTVSVYQTISSERRSRSM